MKGLLGQLRWRKLIKVLSPTNLQLNILNRMQNILLADSEKLKNSRWIED